MKTPEPSRIVAYCPRCAETWPMRLVLAKERGIPVSVLCTVHFAEMRQGAATRVELVGA